MSSQIPFVKFPIYPLAAIIGATPKDSRETYLHFPSDAGDTGGEVPYFKFPENQSVIMSNSFLTEGQGRVFDLEQRVMYLNTAAGGSFTFVVPGDATVYTNDSTDNPYYIGSNIFAFPSGTEVTWTTSNDLVQIGDPALYFVNWVEADGTYVLPFNGKYYYGVLYDGYGGGDQMTLGIINIDTGLLSIVYISAVSSPGTGIIPFPMLFSHVFSSVGDPGTQGSSENNYVFPFCGKEIDVAIPDNLDDLSGFVLPTIEEA